jgi:hypothetical protein
MIFIIPIYIYIWLFGDILTGAKRKEWMVCWGLLGLLFIVIVISIDHPIDITGSFVLSPLIIPEKSRKRKTAPVFVIPIYAIPIGSMYGIYTNIGGIYIYILMVNVTIYSIHGSYGIDKQMIKIFFFHTSVCGYEILINLWLFQDPHFQTTPAVQ